MSDRHIQFHASHLEYLRSDDARAAEPLSGEKVKSARYMGPGTSALEAVLVYIAGQHVRTIELERTDTGARWRVDTVAIQRIVTDTEATSGEHAKRPHHLLGSATSAMNGHTPWLADGAYNSPTFSSTILPSSPNLTR